MTQLIETKPHYPYVTKLLIDLFNNQELSNVRRVVVEPTYGYVGRIEYHNGQVHVFRSTNLGINSLGASEVCELPRVSLCAQLGASVALSCIV